MVNLSTVNRFVSLDFQQDFWYESNIVTVDFRMNMEGTYASPVD